MQLLRAKMLEKKQQEETKVTEQKLQVSTLVQNIQQPRKITTLRCPSIHSPEQIRQDTQEKARQESLICMEKARQLSIQQQAEQKVLQTLNPFSRSLNLKENWGGLTTTFMPDPDETIKALLIKLQKLETVPLADIPDILRTISQSECTFIGSEFLRNLFWCFGDIFKGYEGPHPNALVRSCGYNIQLVRFLYIRNSSGTFERDWYTALTYAFGTSQCIEIVEFLWANENMLLKGIPMISLACKIENVVMVHFLTEKLGIKDVLPNGPQYFTTFSAQLHESIDKMLGIEICCKKNTLTSSLLCVYLLRHNVYSDKIYMALFCFDLAQNRPTCIHEILEQKRISLKGKFAAFLVAKAIQHRNLGIIVRFIREGFPLNGGTTGELAPVLSISQEHLNNPIEYAKSINFTEFLDWLQSYVKEIVGTKSLIMLRSLLLQGFPEEYIGSCYECKVDSPEDIQFLEKILVRPHQEKTKNETMFLFACKTGNIQILNSLIANKKITEVEIQRNDTFFQNVFQSPSSRKLELLKILIDHCGGLEKLEISMQRLNRFCDENPSSESEAIKEYLQGFTKNRLAKKRQISIESDNEEFSNFSNLSTPILQDPSTLTREESSASAPSGPPTTKTRLVSLALSDPLEILANACACEETLQTFICKHCDKPFEKIKSMRGPAPEVCNMCRNHRRRPRKNDNLLNVSKSMANTPAGKVLNLPENPPAQIQPEKVSSLTPLGYESRIHPRKVPILQRSFPTVDAVPVDVPNSTNGPTNMET